MELLMTVDGTGKRKRTIVADGQALTNLSNALVALHRRDFGRGPGAARSFIAEGIAVCILSDVFTPFERTLIDAGEGARVRSTRALHKEALEDEYKHRVEAVVGHQVVAYTSVVHCDPDLSVETFLLD
jgi:uncharacterized protein YbcI